MPKIFCRFYKYVFAVQPVGNGTKFDDESVDPGTLTFAGDAKISIPGMVQLETNTS